MISRSLRRNDPMQLRGIMLSFTLLTSVAAAQTGKCNLDNYRAAAGMTAGQSGDSLMLTWPGESNEQLRAQFAIRNGQPIVTELAARENAGQWIILGKDLTPEFHVTTARRRTSATKQTFL